MIFSVHQPNYIPFLGYFYKIAKSDIFVYLDTVQYPRGQNLSPRNKIKTPNGTIYLTIPVTKPSGNEGKALYTEIEFSNTEWKKKHIKTLEMCYKRATYYDQIMQIYTGSVLQSQNFVNLNIGLIETFLDYLSINTKRIRLSQLENDFGNKTQLIINIAKKINADTYLSGTGGGKDYNDEELFSKNGIKLTYSDFKHPIYPQLWGEFVPNLSIIDLLFNCGRSSKNILMGKDYLSRS